MRVREADLGGWISKFFSGDAEDKVTRPVESVSTNEGLKGTNLRRIDTTSWVSKIDLVLQIEINFFFRLRNIALEIYILVVYTLLLTLILWAMKGQYLSPSLFQLTEYKPNLL